MQIIEDRTISEQKWTYLKAKRYVDRSGVEREWTYIERRNRAPAVVLVAACEQTGSLILIKQYRVPLEREIVEFPAGLVGDGEDPVQAAQRELYEETGYRGTVCDMGPELVTSAGITNETAYLVSMSVGEQPDGEPSPGASEHISVLKLSPKDFSAFLDEARSSGTLMDARVYVYLRENAARIRAEPTEQLPLPLRGIAPLP